MDSSTAPSGSSLASRIWQTTFGKCFSLCRPEEEPQPISVVLLQGELLEAKKVVDDLESSIAAQDASFEICQRMIDETQRKLDEAMLQSREFQTSIEQHTLKYEKLQVVYGNAVKQFEAIEETSKQAMTEAESKQMETSNQKKALQHTIAEQEETINTLTQDNEDLTNRYCDIIENPCTCFFVRHVEEYLYVRYEADAIDIPTIDENISSSQLEARVIVDTDGFVPPENIRFQLSDYEYSDLSVDSDEYSESTSSDDTSDLAVRYINPDVSKATSETNESTAKKEKSSPGQSTSAPAEEEEGEEKEYDEEEDEEDDEEDEEDDEEEEEENEEEEEEEYEAGEGEEENREAMQNEENEEQEEKNYEEEKDYEKENDGTEMKDEVRRVEANEYEVMHDQEEVYEEKKEHVKSEKQKKDEEKEDGVITDGRKDDEEEENDEKKLDQEKDDNVVGDDGKDDKEEKDEEAEDYKLKSDEGKENKVVRGERKDDEKEKDDEEKVDEKGGDEKKKDEQNDDKEGKDNAGEKDEADFDDDFLWPPDFF